MADHQPYDNPPPPPADAPITKVYVGNLPPDTEYADLVDCFGPLGETRQIDLKHGYGFVDYKDHASAVAAVSKYHEGMFLGSKIKVALSNSGNKKDLASRVCYNCQGTGHQARDCRNPTVPRPTNRDHDRYKGPRRDDRPPRDDYRGRGDDRDLRDSRDSRPPPRDDRYREPALSASTRRYDDRVPPPDSRYDDRRPGGGYRAPPIDGPAPPRGGYADRPPYPPAPVADDRYSQGHPYSVAAAPYPYGAPPPPGALPVSMPPAAAPGYDRYADPRSAAPVPVPYDSRGGRDARPYPPAYPDRRGDYRDRSPPRRRSVSPRRNGMPYHDDYAPPHSAPLGYPARSNDGYARDYAPERDARGPPVDSRGPPMNGHMR